MPNDAGAPISDALVLDLSDDDFQIAWFAMTQEQRQAVGESGFERYRKLRPLRKRESIVERAQAKLDAVLLRHRGNDWPAPLDLEALAETEPEPPAFIMPGWLPIGYATGLWGHGGVGKSGIALYLAACIALELSFFGKRVERRRVMYLSCEDREGVLHWRLSRICKHLGISIADLSGWLEIVDLVGHDVVLWEKDPHTGGTYTAAFGRLQERVEKHATELLIVDGISDTYGGNESARTEVKRYVNALVSLIPADRGAVLLLGHIAKSTALAAQSTEGYSGSTAWHNAVRARWYLYPETIQDEDGSCGERSGDLILDLQKSNLGRTDQSMRFAWDATARLFVGREIVGETGLDRAHRDRIEHRDVMRAFKGCAERGVNVPAATSGQRTAYHVLSAAPEFPDTLKRTGKPGRKRFWRIVEKLRQSGALIPDSYKDSNRKWRDSLVLAPEGMRQCVE